MSIKTVATVGKIVQNMKNKMRCDSFWIAVCNCCYGVIGWCEPSTKSFTNVRSFCFLFFYIMAGFSGNLNIFS